MQPSLSLLHHRPLHLCIHPHPHPHLHHHPLHPTLHSFPSPTTTTTTTTTSPLPLNSSIKIKCENGELTQNNNTSVGPGDAVIIVDHGSRRQQSNLMLNEFVHMFKHQTAYHIVEPAHMELAEPSIADAFRSCVQQGAHRIIVTPFFLLPGRHWSQDIPSLTAQAAKDHPGVSYIVTAPLGLHHLLVDVMDDRIKHCLNHAAGDADECSVCAGTGKCRLY